MRRRRYLRALTALGAAGLAGCPGTDDAGNGSDGNGSQSPTGTGTAGTNATATPESTPEPTATPVASPVEVQFEETFAPTSTGGTAEEVFVTSAGDYVLAGSTGTGDRASPWLARVDTDGTLQWDVPYSLTGTLFDVVDRPDGGFVAVGDVENAAGQPLAFAVAVDGEGTQLWEETYDLDATLKSVLRSGEEYFAVGAANLSEIQGLVVAFDSEGTQRLSRQLSGDGLAGLNAVVSRPDGGAVAAGATSTRTEARRQEGRGWLVAFLPGPERQFTQSYSSRHDDVFRTIVADSDGFAIGGHTESDPADGNEDAWLVTTDDSGTQLSSQTYDAGAADRFWGLAAAPDGYLAAGNANLGPGTSDGLLVGAADDGRELWRETFGGSDSGEVDLFSSLVRRASDTYAVAGIRTNSSGTPQAWLVEFTV